MKRRAIALIMAMVLVLEQGNLLYADDTLSFEEAANLEASIDSANMMVIEDDFLNEENDVKQFPEESSGDSDVEPYQDDEAYSVSGTDEQILEEDVVELFESEETLVVGEGINVASGECGEGLTWNLDEDGTLTISGSGSMAYYNTSENTSPFYYNQEIINVVVSEGVTAVSSYAFTGCEKLETVNMPTSVRTIDSGAFSDCTSLEEVTLPSTLERIGYNAFSGCTALTRVDLPEGLTWLGGFMRDDGTWYEDYVTSYGYVFSGCTALEEVTLPKALVSGCYAFNGCSSLKSIHFADGTSDIPQYLFSGCTGLEAIDIPDTARTIGSDAFEGCSSLETVTLHEGLEEIGYRAFADDEVLTGITLPQGLETLGDGAFGWCAALTSINIPRSLASAYGAFTGCENLKEVIIESGRESIPAGLLAGGAIKTLAIEEGVRFIDDRAFSDCTSLEEVTLPSTLERIGRRAFSGCTALTRVELPEGLTWLGGFMRDDGTWYEDYVTSYGYVFSGCTALEEVTLPKALVSGCYAFNGCSSLKSIHFADGTSDIPQYLFSGCTGLEAIDIPDTARTIGSDAFEGCSSLETVTLHEGLEEIGYRAFADDEVLTGITLPQGLETLGDGAFGWCAALTSINIPRSLASAYGAFTGCENLKEVIIESGRESIPAGLLAGGAIETLTIEEGVRFIDDRAFSDCTSLEEVTLPSTLERIGRRAFSGCAALTRVDLPEGLTWLGGFMRDDGTWYEDYVTSYGYVFSGCTALEEVTLPKALVSGCYAFNGCSSLKSIHFADGTSDIPQYLFSGCTGLETIDIPDTARTIGSDAFEGCSSLETVTLHEGLEEIGYRAFADDEVLTGITLPQGLETLGDGAFGWCAALTSINIPRSLASAYGAFTGCENLKEVIIESGRESIPAGLLAGGAIETLTIEEGVRFIDDRAFSDCTSLEEVTLPSTLERIGRRAFSGCAALTRVDLPEGLTWLGGFMRDDGTWYEDYVTYYGDVFSGCTALEEVTLPKALVSGCYAFNGCSSLKSIHFADGTSDIPQYLFSGCTGLETIDIPDTARTIGSDAFEGCSRLETVTLHEGLEEIGYRAFADDEVLTGITLPQGLETLGDGAFGWCTALTSINIPRSLTTADGAFTGCENLKEVIIESGRETIPAGLLAGGAIETLAIEEGVRFIDDRAFSDCTSLEEVTLPSTLERIGRRAFSGCAALKRVDLPEGLTWLGGFMRDDGTWYENYVTSYGDVFSGCTALEGVTLPKALVSACYAFNGCSSLKRVDFADGTSDIPQYLFSGCTGLETIDIPDTVRTIGSNAFEGCSRLETVTLHEGLEEIGYRAFADDEVLTGITLPQGLKTLEYETFGYCAALTSINIPRSLTTADGAFTGCENLKEVDIESGREIIPAGLLAGGAIETLTIEEGIRFIDSGAFSDCTSLEEVTLPSTLERIGYNAFGGCTALKRADLPEGLTWLGGFMRDDGTWYEDYVTYYGDVFSGCTALEEVTLPKALVSACYAFNGCNSLNTFNVIESSEISISELLYDSSNYTYEVEDAEIGEISESGTFIANRKGTTTVKIFRDQNLVREINISVIASSVLEDRKILISSVEGYRGDTVTVQVRLNNLQIENGGEFTIIYDTDRAQLLDADPGSALAGKTCTIDMESRPDAVIVRYDGVSQEAQDDLLAELTFKIPDKAKFGSGSVSGARVIFYGSDGNAYYGKSQSGKLSVLYTVNDSQLEITSNNITLARDYAQQYALTVKNITEKPLKYYLTATNPYEDVYLNFVTSGSEQQPVTIMPQESQIVYLSVFLQNAENGEYRIPVLAHIEKDGQFYDNTRYEAEFKCHIPKYEIGFEKVSVNESTLETKYKLTNLGDSFTDLSVNLGDGLEDYVSIISGYQNYSFGSNETIEVIMKPDLILMKENQLSHLEGTLIATGAGQTISTPLAFDTGGKEIITEEAFRLAMYQDGNPYYDLSVVDGQPESNHSGNVSMTLQEDNSINVSFARDFVYGGSVAEVDVAMNCLPSTRIIVGQEFSTRTDPETGAIVLEIRQNLKEEELKEISKLLSEMGDTLDLDKDTKQYLESLAGVKAGEFSIAVKVMDPLIKELIRQGRDYNKTFDFFLKALDKASKGLGEASDIADIMSFWANPDVSEDDKRAYTLIGVMEKMLGLVSDPTGVATKTYSTGISLVDKLFKTAVGEGPFSELSNYELGEWVFQQVNGSQCTNAGRVSTPFTLATGLKFVFGTYEIYQRLGDGSLTGAYMVGWDSGTRSRSTKTRGGASGCVFVSTRMSGGNGSYIDKNNTAYSIYVNDHLLGSIPNDGLTEVSNFGILSDAFVEGNNTITRVFNTNPGSHQVTTDTQISICIPHDYVAAYLGNIADYEDVRGLPDFAVYPENIYVDFEGKDITQPVVGEACTIQANVYNRGQRGGWTDIIFSDGTNEIYRVDKQYIPAFGHVQLSFMWTPASQTSTISATLINETVDVTERSYNNNTASLPVSVREREKPVIVDIFGTDITFITDSTTVYLAADVENCEDIVSGEFLIDGKSLREETTYSGNYGARRYEVKVYADELSEGNHEIVFSIKYAGGTNQVVNKTVTGIVHHHDCDVDGHLLSFTGEGEWVCESCGQTLTYIGDNQIELEYESVLYDGTEKTPEITVMGVNGKLTVGTDYHVSYSGNILPGVAKVGITGKGNFTGTAELFFTILEDEENPVKKMTGIHIETLPAKTTYYEGEKFDPEGLEAYLDYSDGSAEPASDLTFIGFDSSKTGKQIVKTVYGEVSCSLQVEIVHEKVWTNVSELGCETNGYRQLICKNCGEILDEETTPAYGHNYESEVTHEATCSEKGVISHRCTHCGKTYTESIERIAHTPTTDPAIGATCTGWGRTEGSHCSVCQAVIVASEAVSPLGHTYGEPEYSWADDNSTATAIHTCTRDAAHVETETVDTTSEEKTPATCTGKGTNTYTAVFAKDGFTTQTKDAEDIAPLGHDWGAWLDVTEGDTTSLGLQRRICRRPGCGVSEDRTDITCFAVTISASSYTYDGKEKKPTVTVKNGDAVLTSGTDYTISYADNKNAGIATVTITGKGNYIGTTSKTFTIKKAAAKLTFAETSISKTTKDAAFTNALTKTTDGTVTFKSSNTSIAAVNSASGLVTIKGAGETTITASASAGTNYEAGSASYTLTVTPPASAGFSDVQDPSHPYYKAIYWAADAGITKGYSDGTFGIDRSCTRGEMIMFLWRYAGKSAPKAVSKSPFKDVPTSHAFYKAVLWAYQKGVTKGYSDGTFGINRNVSRGECMMFLWRINGKPEPKAVSKSPFKDVPKTHAFYKAILWGYQKKITTGYTSGAKKGTFGINENCTRGQIVTFLYRAK